MATLRREREAQLARMTDIVARRDKLQAELDDLANEHDKILYALEVLDRVGEDDSPARPRSDAFKRVKDGTRRGRTYNLSLRALARLGGEGDVRAALPIMRELGWDEQPKNPVETVRTNWLRAVEDGAVARAGYGRYKLLIDAADLDSDDDTPTGKVSAFGVDLGTPIPLRQSVEF